MKHLSVIYDEENDTLIYDRTLKDGIGRNMYGIEVCKSMGMPDEFMENLYTIGREIYPENIPLLEHKQTRYNSLKIKNNCEICKKKIWEKKYII